MSEHAIGPTATYLPPNSGLVGSPFFHPTPIATNESVSSSVNPSSSHPVVSLLPHPLVDEDNEPGPELSPETKLADSKEVVTQAFGWMSNDVEAQLSALEADVRAEDVPSFGEQLLRAAFRTALSAATSGASEFVAGLFVKAEAAALRELVKTAIESGVGEALDAGTKALRGSDEPLTGFIAAQKTAVRHLYRKAQAHWIHHGRHRVRTQAQADALEATLTRSNMADAAKPYYDAARDAWIVLLAQARFGVRHSKALDENYDVVDIGTTTDLTPSEQRDTANALRPGEHSSSDSPDTAAAVLGVAQGVLMIEAELPPIRMIGNTGVYGMAGRPKVTHAILNGLNQRIRQQFEGRPLSTANIPRVIVCNVDEGHDFTVRINEKGIVFGGGDAEWLRDRARAGLPQNLGKTSELEQIGLELLLADLVPTKLS